MCSFLVLYGSSKAFYLLFHSTPKGFSHASYGSGKILKKVAFLCIVHSNCSLITSFIGRTFQTFFNTKNIGQSLFSASEIKWLCQCPDSEPLVPLVLPIYMYRRREPLCAGLGKILILPGSRFLFLGSLWGCRRLAITQSRSVSQTVLYERAFGNLYCIRENKKLETAERCHIKRGKQLSTLTPQFD